MRQIVILGIIAVAALIFAANTLLVPRPKAYSQNQSDRELLALTELRKQIDKGTQQLRDLAAEIRKKKSLSTTSPVVERPTPATNPKPHIYGVNTITREFAPEGIPLLVFTYNRPGELDRTLKSILAKRPANFPLFVTQDGNDERVANVINTYREDVYHIRFTYQPGPLTGSYYKIAQHYHFALSYMFDNLDYKQVLILEDDMEIAADFYEYFSALAPILDNDPTLYCVSAWNDNGQGQFVDNPERLYRNDVFPGLGWMMNRKLWNEVGSKWPQGFWDDWLREPSQRKDRNCIYPEINRVYTFGKVGASAGQFFDQFLAPIRLNDQLIRWTTKDLSFLQKEKYDDNLRKSIKNAVQLQSLDDLESSANECERNKEKNCEFVIRYESLGHLTQIENRVGLMSDHKSNIPRSSYRGVVPFRYNHHQLFLIPKDFE